MQSLLCGLFLVDGPGKNARFLRIDEIPKSVFSYYTKWSDFIAKDASCRCSIQICGSDITIQHLMVFFSHRGGKGN
jgi:hypothetical protein